MACTSSSELPVHQDECTETDCGIRPKPKHLCAGGYAVSVCTNARGTCGWQIDCASEPPPDLNPYGMIGDCPYGPMRQCPEPAPAFDPLDCVYGFVGSPSCETYARDEPCTWHPRCRPQPCEQTGTCNILDRSKLGTPCGNGETCPTGSTCASIAVNVGEYIEPNCIAGSGCEALTCAPGRACTVLTSYPGQVVCDKRP